jgi:hypothetical protein
MSAPDRRLQILFTKLSAKERALLVLRARKEGREEDPAVWKTLPFGQREQFDRLIAMLQGINWELHPYLERLGWMASQMRLRLGWLESVNTWAVVVETLAGYIRCLTKEPVTASEHRRLAGVSPDWGSEYEVFPDERADEVAFLREERRLVQAACERSPTDVLSEPARPLAEYEGLKGAEARNMLRDALIEKLVEDVRTGWRKVRAVETVFEEAREEFDGEDPADPSVREMLTEARRKIEETRRALAGYEIEAELQEPGEEELEMVRGLIGWREKAVPFSEAGDSTPGEAGGYGAGAPQFPAT